MKRSVSHKFTAPRLLVILTLFLSAVGLLFVFEASVSESFATFGDPYHFLRQHLIGLAIGLVAFMSALIIPSKTWIKLSPIMYVAGIITLILVFVPGIGMELNGARRWLAIGPFRFQAVELMKLSLIAYLAVWLNKHQKLPQFLLLLGIPALLVMLQPDLGSLLLLSAIAFGMFFLGGGNFKKLAITLGVALPAVLGAIMISDYRRARLMTFLDPTSDPSGASFHIRQITLALGRGGWFGQGIGNSSQKFAYIPEASTDSVFAIIAEEVGFMGSLVLILLLLWFLLLVFKTVTKIEPESPLRLLGLGIFMWLALQIILNLSAVVGLIPLTGMPLPFFSYGRSSQVMILLATGIVIRLGKEAK